MHRPEIDCEQISAARDLAAQLLQRAADFAGHLAGEVHVESKFTDAPGDQVTCLRMLTARKLSMARPLASELTSDAAHPSANTRNESTCSSSVVS